jgi:hypothetical protein
VLEGIQFLQDRGLVLAALSPDAIMLTEDGNVKIGMSRRHSRGWLVD